ncbi:MULTISPECIES: hypothetical protein [unclassified Nocardiopsis]|uniref:hypothetical protein n=1 Tax=unclassified Nocardiopsis TaxID=2649073 RepID=UPI0033D50A8F
MAGSQKSPSPPSDHQPARVSTRVALLALIALICGAATVLLSLHSGVPTGLALIAGAGAAAGAWKFGDGVIR